MRQHSSEKCVESVKYFKMAGNPIDRHVGERLRLRRMLCDVSQQQLGAELGLTSQQVQKYERGINRIGASRLFDIASILDVSVGYFFEEMPETIARRSPAKMKGLRPDNFGALNDDRFFFTNRETLNLVRAYYEIEDDIIRKHLLATIRAIGGEKREESED